METDDHKVYLAGPMTGLPRYNFDAFEEKTKELREKGYRVWSPHEKDLADGFDPDNGEPLTLQEYMATDLPMVCAADMVAVLPGWENSRGANIEVMVARMLDIPVYTVEELLSEGISS